MKQPCSSASFTRRCDAPEVVGPLVSNGGPTTWPWTVSIEYSEEAQHPRGGKTYDADELEGGRKLHQLEQLSLAPSDRAADFYRSPRPPRDRLDGWAYRTRTGVSVLALSDWNCAITSREVGASPAVETRRAQAAWHGFAAPAKISADDL
jgi:hypothetical protein